MKKIVVVISVFLLFFSCTVEQNVTFYNDNSAQIQGEVMMSDLLVQYLSNFSDFGTFNGMIPRDDILAMWEDSPYITVNSLEMLDDEQQGLRFSLNLINWKELADSLPQDDPILSYNEVSGGVDIKINLNRRNFYQLYLLFPHLENPLFQSFAPLPGDSSSRDDFLFMADYALGDGGADAMDNGSVQLHFNPGVYGDTEYSLNLVDLLHLEKPLSYTINVRE